MVLLRFFCICQDVPFYFFPIEQESLSEILTGAITTPLVASARHGDNVSWANERQRREDVLTSIDPCRKEAAGIRVCSCYTINIITKRKECGANTCIHLRELIYAFVSTHSWLLTTTFIDLKGQFTLKNVIF